MTDAGVAGYDRFGPLSRVELQRFFYLDDEDRTLIAARRRDYNRLGFALQVVTVRNLGMFLADPLDVPSELVDYLAEQLGIDDSSCLSQYVGRRPTRFEHQTEIQQAFGLKSFAEVENELTAWIADQAWMTGNGRKIHPDRRGGAASGTAGPAAGDHHVGEVGRLRAGGRRTGGFGLSWRASCPASQAATLLSLLEVLETGKQRVSELDRLRKGVPAVV